MTTADPITETLAKHFGCRPGASSPTGDAAESLAAWAGPRGLETREGLVEIGELESLLTESTAVFLPGRTAEADAGEARGGTRFTGRGTRDNAVLVRIAPGKVRLVTSAGDTREASRAADLLDGTDGPLAAVVVSRREFDSGPAVQKNASPIPPFRRLLQLMRPERGEVAVVAVFALFSGLLALATPLAVEALVTTVAFNRVVTPVVVLALLLFAFLTFEAIVKLFQTYVVELLQRRTYVRLVAALSRGLPRTAPRSFDGQYGPSLVNHFFDVVTVQKVVAGLLLDALTLVVTAFVGMAVLAFYHPFLLGYDIGLLIAITLILTILGRGAVKSAIKESKAKYRTAAWLEEIARLDGTFRQFGGPALAMRNADRVAADYIKYRENHFGTLLRQIAAMLMLQAVASTVLLGLGGALVIQGELTLGQLVAAELIVALVVGAFAKLTKHVEAFYDLLAGVDKIGVLLDLPADQCHGTETPGEKGEAIAVTVRDLVFGVPGHPLPRHADFKVEAGERVAITGPSGSGKSVLSEVLSGQRRRLGGQLTFNQFAPEELLPAARATRIAYVRGNEVFAATVAENVACGRADVTNAAVRDALNRVELLDDVLAAGGLDTPLTASGYPLTDSQARRLTLARAIAGKPGLLIVDGLLDGFEDECLSPIADVVFDRDAPWTLILVSGRCALIDRCDRQIDIGGRVGGSAALVGGNGHADNGNGNGHAH